MAFTHFKYSMPEVTKQTIDDYVEKGYEPGGFVRACLENDLSRALGRADPVNSRHLKDIVGYIHMEIPASVHGSPEKVDAHLAKFKVMARREDVEDI